MGIAIIIFSRFIFLSFIICIFICHALHGMQPFYLSIHYKLPRSGTDLFYALERYKGEGEDEKVEREKDLGNEEEKTFLRFA